MILINTIELLLYKSSIIIIIIIQDDIERKGSVTLEYPDIISDPGTVLLLMLFFVFIASEFVAPIAWQYLCS